MRPSGPTKRTLHDCFAVSEFLKRVVAATFFPVGPNRATVNKPKPPQDFLSAIALRCEPLHPATLYRGDEFAARITPPVIEFVHLDEVITTHFCNPNSSFVALGPRGVSETALAARPVSPGIGIHRERRRQDPMVRFIVAE